MIDGTLIGTIFILVLLFFYALCLGWLTADLVRRNGYYDWVLNKFTRNKKDN